MRLSDAVATGRVLLKPIRGIVFLKRDGAGCALGMALAAVGKLTKNAGVRTAKYEWPWLEKLYSECTLPCGCPSQAATYICGMVPAFSNVFIHLFDGHVVREEPFKENKWTLDQFIDWVRSVEPVEDERGYGAVEATPDSQSGDASSILASPASLER